MYTYRNKKTGEVVQTSNKVSGANWEQVEAKKSPAASPTAESFKATGKGSSKGKSAASKVTSSEEKGGQ